MLNDALALNPQGLDGLRWQARQDGGKESVRAAAQQFESYFLQMMLRSMRQTLAQDGPLDSQETRMFSDMYDQQVAQSVAKTKGLGLADMLVEQLQYSLTTSPVAKTWITLSVPAGAADPFQELSWFRTPPAKMPGAMGARATVRGALDRSSAVTTSRASVFALSSAGTTRLIWSALA